MHTEYSYVHDNEILSYNVDIHNRKLVMLTKYADKERELLEDGIRNAFPIFAKNCEELRNHLGEKINI